MLIGAGCQLGPSVSLNAHRRFASSISLAACGSMFKPRDACRVR